MNTQSIRTTPLNSLPSKSWLQSQLEKHFVAILGDLSEGCLSLTLPCGKNLEFNHSVAVAADLRVHDYRFYRRVLFSGGIGLGEAMMNDWWSSTNPTAVLRFFAKNQADLDRYQRRFEWLLKPYHNLKHRFNRNSISQSKKNISAHYDLGNDLYRNFLDNTMSYSSGLFDHTDYTLEESQYAKIDRLLEQLDLTADDHLLEIGTGWGALAIRAAQRSGCRVTTTTLSEEQWHYATEQVRAAGLSDRITLLLKDYRHLEGQYDKIVSVEMIEAVGREYLPTYFETLEQRLKPGGKVALQSITIDHQRLQHYQNNADFIQTYIFPGGFLPSLSLLQQHVSQDTSMEMIDVMDFGIDYGITIQHWRERFLENLGAIHQHGYDRRFCQLWLFYFAYCEAGFMEKKISVLHCTMEKPGIPASSE